MSEVAGRAFDLLEKVATSRDGLGLMALANATGIDKTTASRLLHFLEQRGLVLRDGDTQRFQAGPALMVLAATTVGRSNLLVAARPHFPLLRDATGETVSVHQRVGWGRVCLGGLESERQVRSAVTSGEQRELFRGSSGKVILAYFSEAELASCIELAREAATDVDALRTELRDIRLKGGLWGPSDRVPGLSAVSVPLFDSSGIVGALTISGPTSRWTGEEIAAVFPQLAHVARQISAQLGSRPDLAMPPTLPRKAEMARASA